MDELTKLKKELKDLEKQKKITEVKKQIAAIKNPSKIKGVGKKVGDFFRPRGDEKEKLKDLLSY